MPEFLEVSCAVILESDPGHAGALPLPQRILVTRRSTAMPHPLKWEFPGGKLRPGESAGESIVREIREELGVEIRVLSRLHPVEHQYAERSIRLLPQVCTLIQHAVSREIRLSEHADWKWVLCSELDDLDWLEADLGVVKQVRDGLCR